MKNIIDAEASPAAAAVQTLTVDEESAGQRLDNFLIRHLKGVPKTHVYRIIRTGEVRVNKGRASADTRVQTGDVVRVPPVRVATPDADAPPVPGREFPVLMEDDHMLAINKPAGVAVHGGSGVSFGVIEQLRQARPAARMLELVHRLDRETSGVLLVAKNAAHSPACRTSSVTAKPAKPTLPWCMGSGHRIKKSSICRFSAICCLTVWGRANDAYASRR